MLVWPKAAPPNPLLVAEFPHTGLQIPQLSPLNMSEIPAPVTPSITTCAVLPISPSRDGSTGMNKLVDTPQPVT